MIAEEIVPDQCVAAAELERVIRIYLDCQDRPISELHPALTALLPVLGQAYGQRLAARLTELGVQSVSIVACGPLGLLPLHAATFERNGRETSLIESFDVTFAPSARILSALRTRLGELPPRSLSLAAVEQSSDTADSPSIFRARSGTGGQLL